MRAAFREQLDQFTHDLYLMADFARSAMVSATEALLSADLATAERVVSSIDAIDDLRERSETHAFALLALEGPVASDLRQVVSGLYIVEDCARMAALAVHVAKMTRRRHPEVAVPEPIRPYIAEMSRLATDAAAKVKDLLVNPDAEQALKLSQDDDAVDDIHQHLFQLTTQREWEFTVKDAVDVTLLSRFLERYSDHAVKIGSRIVYTASGMRPVEFEDAKRSTSREASVEDQFKQISSLYGRRWQ